MLIREVDYATLVQLNKKEENIRWRDSPECDNTPLKIQIVQLLPLPAGTNTGKCCLRQRQSTEDSTMSESNTG